MKKRIIRLLNVNDTEALLVFANALIAEDTFLMLSGDKITLAHEKKYVADTLDEMKKHIKIRFVVTLGAQIIGSAEIRRGGGRKHHMGEIGLSILKPYRGKGLGNILMQRLINEGKRMGLRTLTLHCFENNDAALGLYKKFGFVACGLLPEAYHYRDLYVGEVTLYKNLIRRKHSVI